MSIKNRKELFIYMKNSKKTNEYRSWVCICNVLGNRHVNDKAVGEKQGNKTLKSYLPCFIWLEVLVKNS
jgi:hypothetical protein